MGRYFYLLSFLDKSKNMDNKLQNSISTKELYREYNWYQHTFPELVQNSCDAFFDKNFKLSFIGLSKNINCLLNNESCFVTKVKIDEEYEMFFRLTDSAIDVILNKVLGKSKHRFNINKISDLEAKVITSFNGFMFSALKEQLNNPNPTELKRTNFDVVHLTFLLEDTDEYIDKTGKIIITLPLALLSPEEISSTGDKFSEDEFPNSETMAKVLVGKTRFSLFDLKNLETDDVVVFEDSDIENLTLSIQGEEMAVNINPNMDLLIPETDDGGDNMGETHKNIWDSIEVDMYAEFDAVKVTLGELKNIESGLVVDLTSLYDHKVTVLKLMKLLLKAENLQPLLQPAMKIQKKNIQMMKNQQTKQIIQVKMKTKCRLREKKTAKTEKKISITAILNLKTKIFNKLNFIR